MPLILLGGDLISFASLERVFIDVNLHTSRNNKTQLLILQFSYDSDSTQREPSILNIGPIYNYLFSIVIRTYLYVQLLKCT